MLNYFTTIIVCVTLPPEEARVETPDCIRIVADLIGAGFADEKSAPGLPLLRKGMLNELLCG